MSTQTVPAAYSLLGAIAPLRHWRTERSTGEKISHYRIIDEIGHGGMGVVYLAEDTKLRRTVALKFLPVSLSREPEARDRFIGEAQAASALQHNNICTIHDIDWTDDGLMFIVMDLYQGETLGKLTGPLPRRSR
jgi:serine/threonine protein kinase